MSTEFKRLDKVADEISRRTKVPNNAKHQYQLNRDYGYVLGLMATIGSDMDALIDNIEDEYDL